MRQRNNGLRKICGCPRRTWAKCPHGWHLNFKPRSGPAYRLSIDRYLGRHVDSKTEAETAADNIRQAIRDGVFGLPVPRAALTLRDLADLYLERWAAVQHAATYQGFVYAMNTICRTALPCPGGGTRPLGAWRVADIVTDTIERFREARLAAGVGLGVSRNLQSLRALFSWAIRVGYVETTPFRRGTEAVVNVPRGLNRTRRLRDDEEARLLAVCGDRLRALVIAAIETGMRAGEILSLQWSQVEGMTIERRTVTWTPRAALFLPATKTKTKRDRWIPLSTRLRAILEMRRLDPAGKPLGPELYVFGNEIGQRVESYKRAWDWAVLKAHGHKPTYTSSGRLDADARTLVHGIDLHFHDLRREAGSRWLEGGVPIHTVRDWLGHSNIAQTSTYLAGSTTTQADAMAAYEARRANLQQLATDSKTGGRKSPSSAGGRAKNANKTAVGREAVLM